MNESNQTSQPEGKYESPLSSCGHLCNCASFDVPEPVEHPESAHEWLHDALGRYQVTHIHSSIREALKVMDITENRPVEQGEQIGCTVDEEGCAVAICADIPAPSEPELPPRYNPAIGKYVKYEEHCREIQKLQDEIERRSSVEATHSQMIANLQQQLAQMENEEKDGDEIISQGARRVAELQQQLKRIEDNHAASIESQAAHLKREQTLGRENRELQQQLKLDNAQKDKRFIDKTLLIIIGMLCGATIQWILSHVHVSWQ